LKTKHLQGPDLIDDDIIVIYHGVYYFCDYDDTEFEWFDNCNNYKPGEDYIFIKDLNKDKNRKLTTGRVYTNTKHGDTYIMVIGDDSCEYLVNWDEIKSYNKVEYRINKLNRILKYES